MKNRNTGFLIIIIAILIGFIIFSFNMALTDIAVSACSHGPECPMWGTIDFQTNVSMGVMVFVIMIGLYLIFFGKEEKIIREVRTIKQQVEPKRMTKGNYKKIMNKLNADEKVTLDKVIESDGTIFQSELVDKTKLNKVKMTRILDRLEGMGIIERRRRGMTNVIVLKHEKQ
ncbi:helix-turn-helix transcriptional regulator [Candidatus Aenigmatarchaeota archaeon]